ncbi:MAG: putative lipoprotein [Proteobacteria bacterium]|nr:putative lipoprotein [Pseudomonadota bacterium]
MKKLLMILVLLALATACTSGRSSSDQASAFYDLGAAPAKTVGAAGFSSLALEVRMPLWLASAVNIQYRLHYNDPVRLYEYAGARWVGAPSALVRQRLQQQLALPVGQNSGLASCLLVFDISEFGQVFNRPEASHGLISGEFRLNGRDQKLLAARHFRIERVAATQDARGGVLALAEAVDALAGEASAWLRLLPKDSRVAACRGEVR